MPKPVPAPAPKPAPKPQQSHQQAIPFIAVVQEKPLVREVPFIAEVDISAQAQIEPHKHTHHAQTPAAGKCESGKCELGKCEQKSAPAEKQALAGRKNRGGKAKQSMEGCPCGPGMICVNKQKWLELYEADQGFNRGTLFSELDLPFMGEGDCKRG